jgi:hypothetical protein
LEELGLIHAAIDEAMKDGYRDGVSASQLVTMIDMELGGSPRYPAIREAVELVCNGRPTSQKLGRRLKLYTRRVLNGRFLIAIDNKNTKVNTWVLRGGDRPSAAQRQESVVESQDSDYPEAY